MCLAFVYICPTVLHVDSVHVFMILSQYKSPCEERPADSGGGAGGSRKVFPHPGTIGRDGQTLWQCFSQGKDKQC